MGKPNIEQNHSLRSKNGGYPRRPGLGSACPGCRTSSRVKKEMGNENFNFFESDFNVGLVPDFVKGGIHSFDEMIYGFSIKPNHAWRDK